jgi:hypothetical protein
VAAWATLAVLVLVVVTGHFVWLIIAALIVVPVLVLLVALARFFDLTVFRR